MQNVQTLKGFRDFLPEQARKRQYVIDVLRKTFESYGFEPLETPTLEYEEILTGKYGDEGDKLLYRFEDNGHRRVAMRYDQTVPLARVVAQYQNELPFPFKRYQMQNVWRAENTQKGRFREFMQCDIDTVGTASPLADAEILTVAAKSLEALGFTNYKILMNDRKVFTRLVDENLLTEKEMFIFVRTLDKLKKIGRDGVLQELVENSFERQKAENLLQLIEQQEKTDTINDIHLVLEDSEIDKNKLIFDPTLARGLDYYTSLIFEVVIDEYDAGSVCGGGRYDNLIGMFANQQIPAAGFAFGFDRVLDAMEQCNLFPNDLLTTKVLVTIFSPEYKQKSIELASLLRENNINTELYLDETAKIEKQLKYANQKRIPYVIILGPEEVNNNTVTLRNMRTREQEIILQSELRNKL